MTDPFLKKLAAAGGLSAEDRRLLSEAVSDVRHFAPDQDIIREGARPDDVKLIVAGWACRYQLLRNGSRQITAFMLPGDLSDVHVTMLGVMDHSIGSLTIASVAAIPRATMLELTARPQIARAFWWASLVDEAVLRAWIVNMGRRDSFDRVAHLICELHARMETVGLAHGSSFRLPLTQEDLSDALGLTGVHVNRTLAKLREAGLMTFKRGEIAIIDIAALRKQSGFDPTYLHLAPLVPLSPSG